MNPLRLLGTADCDGGLAAPWVDLLLAGLFQPFVQRAQAGKIDVFRDGLVPAVEYPKPEASPFDDVPDGVAFDGDPALRLHGFGWEGRRRSTPVIDPILIVEDRILRHSGHADPTPGDLDTGRGFRRQDAGAGIGTGIGFPEIPIALAGDGRAEHLCRCDVDGQACEARQYQQLHVGAPHPYQMPANARAGAEVTLRAHAAATMGNSSTRVV